MIFTVDRDGLRGLFLVKTCRTSKLLASLGIFSGQVFRVVRLVLLLHLIGSQQVSLEKRLIQITVIVIWRHLVIDRGVAKSTQCSGGFVYWLQITIRVLEICGGFVRLLERVLGLPCRRVLVYEWNRVFCSSTQNFWFLNLYSLFLSLHVLSNRRNTAIVGFFLLVFLFSAFIWLERKFLWLFKLRHLFYSFDYGVWSITIVIVMHLLRFLYF